jgi:uncharacterized membrane protein
MTHPKHRQQPHQLSPFVLQQQKERAEQFQLHIADKITAFAGSMNFVYLHAIIFAVWILFIESRPWPTLTLIVSLEAIFLSTFVMIGQNRQSAFQQAKADHDFEASEKELHSNTDITRAIHQLTSDIHEHLIPNGARGAQDDDAASAAPTSSNPQNNHSEKGK